MKKLSEYNTKDGMQVVARLAPRVADITGDKEFLAIVTNIVKTDNRENFIIAGINRISEIAPIIFDKKQKACIEILAIMSDATVEEIEQQPFVKSLADFISLFKDKDFIDFFKSCLGTAENE